MFRKVLIANRGEIAVRIARTCRELGTGTVAVYSDADRTALHVRIADEAYCIGPAPVRESYLNIDAILAAAERSGANAIHPGYGFLSENAEFAERVTAAGLVFIGPPAAAIRAMGDKAAAKRLMIQAGVSVVPGYEGAPQDDERLTAEARRVGFPLLVKAAAGGGGRGMREVRAPEEFAEQLESARREALSAFGDDRVLLERLVEGARHVEVQVFGDAHGNVLYLGERDCSTQRRHQKVIEESPSPAVDEELRSRMGEAAVRAARAVEYTNAGTVEFLLDRDRRFYFLEMNTRLQVEHPVTEYVTGLDLVRLQLEVAAGRPLPFTQDEVHLRGHAIEARLYAEDPFREHLPSSGRLRQFHMPMDEDVRIDAGYIDGDTVSPYYDPLLAKIIAGAADREAAIESLSFALEFTYVAGVATNVPLLSAVIASEEFKGGEVTVDFLDAFWANGERATRPPADVLLAAAGFYLTDRFAVGSRRSDPWQALDTWRLSATARPLPLVVNGRTVALTARPGDRPGEWAIAFDGEAITASFDRVSDEYLLVRRHGKVTPFTQRGRPGTRRSIKHADTWYDVRLGVPQTPEAAAAAVATAVGGGTLAAPMPGLVVKLNVAEGDHVRMHQTLAVLEAMKMEHAIRANADGRVKRVHCAAGERVTGGAPLIELEPLGLT